MAVLYPQASPTPGQQVFYMPMYMVPNCTSGTVNICQAQAAPLPAAPSAGSMLCHPVVVVPPVAAVALPQSLPLATPVREAASAAAATTPTTERTGESCNISVGPSVASAVSAERFRGTVKSFNTGSGFGFIKCPVLYKRYRRDVFVHRKDHRGLRAGDKVEFELHSDKAGLRAVNVVPLQPGPSHSQAAAAAAATGEDLDGMPSLLVQDGAEPEPAM
eukprot:TRINITY_DN104_c0_g1_i1.p1 TRINITY_DN104_c0_g1~~TRINITY_DN104_c0_g1_i1.p1  ORF type:complete len:244 (+),score=21.82 TRINITY_DN104_c0_g1_i1:81-734(+)